LFGIEAVVIEPVFAVRLFDLQKIEPNDVAYVVAVSSLKKLLISTYDQKQALK